MKRLTEGVYQTIDDLIAANANYFWHALFWITTFHSAM